MTESLPTDIDIVIAADDTGDYLKWWPICSLLWYQQTGIKPTLLYFGNGTPSNPVGCPIHTPDMPDGPKLFRATYGRFWWAAHNCRSRTLIWDVDCLPTDGAAIIRHCGDASAKILLQPPKSTWILASGILLTAEMLRTKTGMLPDWRSEYERVKAIYPGLRHRHEAHRKQAAFDCLWGMDEKMLNMYFSDIPRAHIPFEDDSIKISAQDRKLRGLVCVHPTWNNRCFESYLPRLRLLLSELNTPSNILPESRVCISSPHVFRKAIQKWTFEDTICGPGSTTAITKTLVLGLRNWLGEQQINTITDIPCGDATWIGNVLTGQRYSGYDLLPEMLFRARERSIPNAVFSIGDVLVGGFTVSELVLCRDLLPHLPLTTIQRALHVLRDTSSKYIAMTTFPGAVNVDCLVGGWRPLDMSVAPFNLGAPTVLLDETETHKGLQKKLGIWTVDSVCQALRRVQQTPSVQPQKQRYKLAVLAMFKNEAADMDEWIQHYLHRGVEHFYLGDDGSTDAVREVLQPYLTAGQVTLLPVEEPALKQGRQDDFYRKQHARLKRETEWLLICDLDEFVWCKSALSLIPYTEELTRKNRSGVGFWMTDFGSSDATIQPETLVENFIRRRVMDAASIPLLGGQRKWLTRPGKLRRLDMHNPTGMTTLIPPSKTGITSDILQCNHYKYQSLARWQKLIVPRGSANGSESVLHRHSLEFFMHNNPDCNRVIDTGLLEQNRKHGIVYQRPERLKHLYKSYGDSPCLNTSNSPQPSPAP